MTLSTVLFIGFIPLVKLTTNVASKLISTGILSQTGPEICKSIQIFAIPANNMFLLEYARSFKCEILIQN